MTKIAPPDSDSATRDKVSVRGRSAIGATDDGDLLIPAEIVRIEHNFVIVHAGCVAEASIPIKEFANAHGGVDVKRGDFVFIPFDAFKHGAGGTFLYGDTSRSLICWRALEPPKKSDRVGVGKVAGALSVLIDGVCAFLPEALADKRFAKKFNKLLGQNLGFHASGVDCEFPYVVSRRAVLDWATAARRHELLDALEDSGTSTVEDGAVNDVTRPLDLAEQDAVLMQLPEWVRERRTTEILLVDFRIGGRDDTDDLAEFVMEHCPAPIRAGLIGNRLNDIDTDGLMALALFPSGAVRTVGLVQGGGNGSVMLAPFDYWSLIDPDDTQQQVQPHQELSGQLYIFAVGVQ